MQAEPIVQLRTRDIPVTGVRQHSRHVAQVSTRTSTWGAEGWTIGREGVGHHRVSTAITRGICAGAFPSDYPFPATSHLPGFCLPVCPFSFMGCDADA